MCAISWRLAAFRNVWWSMANEYDFMLKNIPMELWDELFQTVERCDPAGHLRSIHQALQDYDYTKPWVTHASIQKWDIHQTKAWIRDYGKPVVNDEPEYEGDIPHAWGNISARELVHRFWYIFANGAYAGHGETYPSEDVLWWAKGGVLHGESVPRIAFLRRIMEEGPAGGLTPMEDAVLGAHGCGHERGLSPDSTSERTSRLWSRGCPRTFPTRST